MGNIIESCKNIKLPGSDGVMPIAGYFGPHHPFERRGYITPDYMSDEIFSLVEKAGINLINYMEYNYATNPEAYHDVLQLAEKYHIGVFVQDGRLCPDMTDEEISECISAYSGYQSFAGIYVADEPSTDYFPRKLEGFDQKLTRRFLSAYAPLSSKVNSYDNMIGYVNLLPNYHWMGSTVEMYEKYLEEFCETCNPKFISFDHYPFSVFYEGKTPEAFHYYFSNLSSIYKYAKRYHLPIWAFVQAGGNWDSVLKDVEMYYPNEQETLWLVNINLAYGAKGIEYYPLLQVYLSALKSDETLDCERSGLIGADGQPTRYYEYARKANEQIAVVDEILLACESEGLIAVNGAAELAEGCYGFMEKNAFRELAEVESGAAGAVVGCFDYHGKTVLYVVNQDMAESQKIVLRFTKECMLHLLAVNCDEIQKTQTLEWELAAGAAILIEVN